MPQPFASVDEYIATFPAPAQAHLQQLRNALRERVPDATEAITYGMPTMMLHGKLVHFAGWKKHLGIYGMAPSPALAAAVAPYAGAKGSLLFPWNQPLPLSLILDIVVEAAGRRRAAAAGTPSQ